MNTESTDRPARNVAEKAMGRNGERSKAAWPSRPRLVPRKSILRHHAGSLLATAVDFVVMAGLVEMAHASPVAATAMSALCGALVSFLLGRHWIFGGTDGRVAGQLVRYSLVAATSLVLNTLGEHVATHVGIGYLLARLVVAFMVSRLWNYPLHRSFVFVASSRPKPRR